MTIWCVSGYSVDAGHFLDAAILEVVGGAPQYNQRGKVKQILLENPPKNIQAIDLIFNNLVFFLLRGVYLHSGRQHATCASPRIGNRGERPLMQFNKGFISNMLVKRYQLVLTLTQYN